MTTPRSKNRTSGGATPAKPTLRFDERELSPNSLAAKRQAFISAVDSTPGASVEIFAADREGVDFWVGSLGVIFLTADRPTLRVELGEKETPIFDSEMSPELEAVIKARMYYSSQNAIYAAESFCASIFAGKYPEWPILKWLEKGLLRSLEIHRTNQAKPKNSLDHILGFSSKKGGTPGMRAALNAERNQMLLLDMARLRSLVFTKSTGKDLKLSIDDAAAMVAGRLKNTPDWNKSSWSIKKLGVDFLVKLYNAWSLRGALELQLKNEQTSKWSAKEKREYLGKYPEESRPLWLNQILDK